MPGALRVTKTIAGPAAGRQGAITIAVSCDGDRLPDFVIPAGTGAGPVSHNYPSIRAGAHCTVTETADGRTGTVVAADTGGGQIVEIAADATAAANLTDSYTDVPGSLVVNKSIAGPAAGPELTSVANSGLLDLPCRPAACLCVGMSVGPLRPAWVSVAQSKRRPE